MTPDFDKQFNRIQKMLTESMTISVADADRTTETLGEISSRLNHQFHEFMLKNAYSIDNYPDDMRGDKVVVDGASDYNGTEGILTVYLRGVSEELQKKLLPMLVYYVNEYNGELNGSPYMDKSRIQKDTQTYRIPVKMKSTENPPELNMANANAVALFHDILNYPKDELWDGLSIQVNELMMKIGQIEDNDYQIGKGTQEASQDGIMYIGARTPDYIKRCLNDVKEICQWAIDNDYSTIHVG